MGQVYYTSAPEVQEIAKAAFPDYNGKKFGVTTFDGPMDLASHWDGGSRTYYAVINLGTMKSAEVPQSGTMFDKQTYRMSTLPPNFAVVEHRIFQGKDLGITIHVNPQSISKMLPKQDEVSWAEKVVLSATRSLKSSYAGVPDYRFQQALKQTTITKAEWDAAKVRLIQGGFLNRAGAITDKGKNAIGWTDLYKLKRPEEEQPKPASPPVEPSQLPPPEEIKE